MHTVGLPRTCLGFTNLLFFVFGLIGFVICVWCATNTDFFRDVNYTITKSPLVDVVAKFVNLRLWVTPLTSILIPIAGLAMMTSCCGVLGAGCKMKCAIKAYIFLATILSFVAFWVIFITGVYNIYTKNENTRRSIQASVHTSYGKDNDFFTYMLDYIMVKYECCGVVSYRDFSKSHWQSLHPSQIYPIQCCKLANVSSLVPVSKGCSKSLDPDIQSNKEVGCFHALRIAIIKNKGTLIFYVVLIGFLYSIVTLFAYCILRGEPLLGAMAGQWAEWLPSKAPRVEANNVETPSAPLVCVEQPPQKVVRMVSAVNPFQSYTLTPSAYSRPEDYRADIYRTHSMRK